jgi:hypothetical protein
MGLVPYRTIAEASDCGRAPDIETALSLSGCLALPGTY